MDLLLIIILLVLLHQQQKPIVQAKDTNGATLPRQPMPQLMPAGVWEKLKIVPLILRPEK